VQSSRLFAGSKLPIVRRSYRRAVLREVPTMTQLAANGIRAPIGAYPLNEEDRATHRRWARGCTIAYSVVIIALLATGFWFRAPQDWQMARESRTVGAGAMTPPPAAPPTGSGQKRNYF
jgi:hypothetical protein